MEEEETGGMQQQQQGILEEIHSQRRREERSLYPTVGFFQYPTTEFFVEYAQQLESLNTEQQQQQQQQQQEEEEEEEEEEISLLERRREKKRICNCGRRRTTFQGAQAAVTQSAGWSQSRGPARLSLWVVVVSISRRSRGRLVSYMTISS
jgi:cell division protein FtsB